MFKKVKSLIVPRLVNRLQRIQKQLISPQTEDIYSSLTPVDNADKDNVYSTALDWALTNVRTRDIKNIAITGPYGSGKSSILKTFQKKNAHRFKFLNISLATFKEEKNENQDEQSQQDQLRLIELSILQQIFYREKPGDIPDSRFKRIVGLSNVEIAARSLCVVIFGLSTLFVLDKGLIGLRFSDIPYYNVWEKIVRWISIAIIGLCIWYIIGTSMRLISKIRLKKNYYTRRRLRG